MYPHKQLYVNYNYFLNGSYSSMLQKKAIPIARYKTTWLAGAPQPSLSMQAVYFIFIVVEYCWAFCGMLYSDMN